VHILAFAPRAVKSSRKFSAEVIMPAQIQVTMAASFALDGAVSDKTCGIDFWEKSSWCKGKPFESNLPKSLLQEV
jgi:hypothetical protein